MRQNTESSLKDALQAFLQSKTIRAKYNEIRVRSVWEACMGKITARYTTQINLRGTVLHLTVSSAPLRQDLLLRKNEIVQLLNEKLEEIVVQSIEIF